MWLEFIWGMWGELNNGRANTEQTTADIITNKLRQCLTAATVYAERVKAKTYMAMITSTIIRYNTNINTKKIHVSFIHCTALRTATPTKIMQKYTHINTNNIDTTNDTTAMMLTTQK